MAEEGKVEVDVALITFSSVSEAHTDDVREQFGKIPNAVVLHPAPELQLLNLGGTPVQEKTLSHIAGAHATDVREEMAA